MNPELTGCAELNMNDFKVFPRHVGVWQGEWLRLDANGQEIARFTATLTKQIVNNQWIQSNTYHYSDGQTVTQNFVGVAIGKGVIHIQGTDSPFADFKAIAEEHGETLIIFNVWDKASNALIGTETINLVRPDYCVRTSQGFHADGTLKSIMVITEHRIAPSEG